VTLRGLRWKMKRDEGFHYSSRSRVEMRLKKESREKVDDIQTLCTCKTMLSLPETRQYIVNEASKTRGDSTRGPVVPN
jgi:hypothetical protein